MLHKNFIKRRHCGVHALARCISVAALCSFTIAAEAADDRYASCGVSIVTDARSPDDNQPRCLGYADTSNGQQARLLGCADTSHILWNIKMAGDGGLFLEPITNHDAVLEVSNWSTHRGQFSNDGNIVSGRVQFWGRNIPSQRSSQEWNIVPRVGQAHSSAINIVNENSQLCLDIVWGAIRTNNVVWQWPCNGPAAQAWILTAGETCPDPRIPHDN